MKKSPLAALILLAAGCGSGSRELRTKFELCELNSGEMRGKLNDNAAKISGLQSQIKDLEGQAADLDSRLKAQQERIDSLNKSNKDLSSALESNQGELSGKLAEAIKEKDEAARQLDALRKDKIAADRGRSNMRAARDKLAAELAALKAQNDELSAASAARRAQEDKTREDHARLLTKVHDDLGGLADSILKEIQAEQAHIAQEGEAIRVVLQEPLLFKPQQAKLTEEGVALLDRLGRALQALGPRDIRVEGHSDNSRIKWDLFGFASHWDVSSARGTTVARYLHEHSGLDPRRLTAAGFGEFRPVKGNDTAEGRDANRRVVLVIEPPTASP